MGSNDMGNLASGGVHDFAEWALKPENKAFRESAAVNLKDALAHTTGAPPLSADEVEFCAGWIFLARMDLGTDNPEALDKHLVTRAQATLDNDMVHVMSG